jgi:hypothetical protein
MEFPISSVLVSLKLDAVMSPTEIHFYQLSIGLSVSQHILNRCVISNRQKRCSPNHRIIAIQDSERGTA